MTHFLWYKGSANDSNYPTYLRKKSINDTPYSINGNKCILELGIIQTLVGQRLLVKQGSLVSITVCNSIWLFYLLFSRRMGRLFSWYKGFRTVECFDSLECTSEIIVALYREYKVVFPLFETEMFGFLIY